MNIVFLAEYPNRLAASCCIVLVVKGAGGCLATSLRRTEPTTKSDFLSSAVICSARSLSRIANLSNGCPFIFTKSNSATSESLSNSATTVQYSSALNFRISFSRSTINLTATDCTRPAESPRATFFHKNGESL